MKTKKLLLSSLALTLLVASCKKKDADPEPEPSTTTTTTTTGAPVVMEYTYSQSIGSSGTGFNEFNFNMGGNEHAWTIATDGNFVYVGDFGNHCIKKVDLSNNTFVGWYGFKSGVWGYYTAYTTAPDPVFKPARVVYKNGFIYAFSKKGFTGKSVMYRFDVGANFAIDTSRVIDEQSFYSVAVDTYENVYTVYGDSIHKYTYSGTVTRFGGFGSGDGKLNNSGSVVQCVFNGDTLAVLDPGNDRVQKFNPTGTFISKFAVTSSKSYACMALYNNQYYMLGQNGKLLEYNAAGTLLNSYTIKNNPSGFSPGQKQLLVAGNKLIFQDMFNHKLHIYTK